MLSHFLPKPTAIRDFLQPAPAWTAILGLILFTTLAILAGAGKILNLAFPAGAFLVGILLYFRYPLLYTSFTWWLFFLSAFVRRLADYRSGYTEPSPILLAPQLVGMLTFITLWRNLPKAQQQGSLPFALSAISVIYGFLIALINRSAVKAILSLFNWLIPVTFGWHLFVHWRDYPSYRQNAQRTFAWGVLVMGLYGIYQYVVAPEWDRYWLISSDLLTSQGKPEPYGMRIWSTMNSLEPFAATMAAGLLLLLTGKGALNTVASGAGYLAFLVSTARSAWLGWLSGFVILSGSLKPKYQIRLIITVFVISVLVIPLATIEPFASRINQRLQTFSNIQEDQSAEGRQETYGYLMDTALTNFTGDGLGGPSYDSAILSLLLNLGWLGVVFYMGGILLIVSKLFQGAESRTDPFIGAARAIVMSCLIRLPVNGVIGGASGLLLWGFLALGLAAQKYNHYQRTAEIRQSLPQSPP